jgi:antitoxin HicB
MISYPAEIIEEDGYTIKFIDFPDIMTEGDTLEELVENAEDALSLVLGYRFDLEREIPEPSQVEGNNIIFVDVLPHVALPIMLHRARKKRNITLREAAKKTKRKYQTYQRFEKVNSFNARMKTIEELARAMGKKLVVDLVDRAAKK